MRRGPSDPLRDGRKGLHSRRSRLQNLFVSVQRWSVRIAWRSTSESSRRTAELAYFLRFGLVEQVRRRISRSGLARANKRPQAFSKLQAMKQQWGDTPGMIMHVVAYSILPLVLGVISILAGMRGESMF
jgi:hypothetical protein